MIARPSLTATSQPQGTIARKYATRHKSIQAIRFSIENHMDIMRFCPGAELDSRVSLHIPVGDGYEHARVGQWIVKHSSGQYEVLNHADFKDLYVETALSSRMGGAL